MASSQSARKQKAENTSSPRGEISRTYTTKSGVLLVLKPIPAILLYQIQMQWDAKKPPVPMRKVLVRGHSVTEADPTNKDYQTALAEWRNGYLFSTAAVMIKLGIANDAPEDFSAEILDALPEMSAGDLRVTWVYSILEDGEVENLSGAIMGQTMITEEGLAQAASTFQGAD